MFPPVVAYLLGWGDSEFNAMLPSSKRLRKRFYALLWTSPEAAREISTLSETCGRAEATLARPTKKGGLAAALSSGLSASAQSE
jgi:hypothetical protein